MKLFSLFSLFFLLIFPAFSQKIPHYKNPDLPVETRVQDLLSRMTPEEKFWQLFMIPGDPDNGKENFSNGIFGLQVRGVENTEAVKKVNRIQKYFIEESRLGIPVIFFEEALHGLVAPGATSFPQSIALAATWDTALMGRVALAIAHETKSRGIRQVLSPVVNIASDVRWGRVEETYGEDPLLTSLMGIAYVNAFEKNGIITTPKHFLANVGDGGRDSYPIDLNERALEEIFLPPFRACFEQGGSRSVMTSYNSLDGSPCTANNWLLNTKLKQQMHFTGFSISDACAVGGANVLHYTASGYPDASAKAINNGLDVIFQTEFDHYKLFIPPFLDGRIDPRNIDESVARVLRVKFGMGLFDHPYVEEKEYGKWNNNPAHKALAKEAALESIVLLKNENQALPLRKSIKKLAVIGADAVEARLGGYSGPGKGKISIFDGLKNKMGSTCEVLYSPGCGRNSPEWITVPSPALTTDSDGKTINGLTAEYFNNTGLSGTPELTRTDKEISFNWTLYPPDPKINYDFFSARWTGKITCPETGHFKIGLDGNDGYRLYLEGKLCIDNWRNQSCRTLLTDFYFEKDKAYDLKVEFFESSGGAMLNLVWNAGVTSDWQQKIEDAAATGNKADVTLVVAGINEGEGYDRAHLNLPGHQEEMINRIAQNGKQVVVVLVGGSAIAMSNWMDHVDGILDVWYPGEEGGNAVADILFGEYNPAGRLPVTFPVAEGQLPLVYNHKPTGRNDDYGDLRGQPLFPFGYGLSYSTFAYNDLKFGKQQISTMDSSVVSFKVKNTSPVDGDEVVQLYIRDLLSSVSLPVKELKGFQRVRLRAGEEKEISFTITPNLLKILNKEMKWVVEPGDFRIMIGASSGDIRLRGVLNIEMAK